MLDCLKKYHKVSHWPLRYFLSVKGNIQFIGTDLKIQANSARFAGSIMGLFRMEMVGIEREGQIEPAFDAGNQNHKHFTWLWNL